MERHYDLMALQLNTSPASIKEQFSKSKIGTQFLIKEYIKKCDSGLLPDPVFVALQDDITANDCKNIQSAFKERHESTQMDLVEASKTEKGISLPYDRTILTELKDPEWTLAENDFTFSSTKAKRRRI